MKKNSAISPSQKKALMVGLSVVALSGAGAGSAQKAYAQNVTCPQSLLFGNITACGSGGDVTVRPDNTRNLTNCLTAGGGAFSRAQCVVTQTFPTSAVKISVTTDPLIISTSVAETMTVTNFNLETNNGGTTHITTTLVATIDIGATLNVGAGQAPGQYKGTFTVQANFN